MQYPETQQFLLLLLLQLPKSSFHPIFSSHILQTVLIGTGALHWPSVSTIYEKALLLLNRGFSTELVFPLFTFYIPDYKIGLLLHCLYITLCSTEIPFMIPFDFQADCHGTITTLHIVEQTSSTDPESHHLYSLQAEPHCCS